MGDESFETPQPTLEEKQGITGTTLKIIAMIAMFIDHFAAIFISDYLTTMSIPPAGSLQEQTLWHAQNDPKLAVISTILVIMRLIGRFGFPLFAFLIVEGFQHTHSVKKYALNLAIFSVISELPFNLGFTSKLFYTGYQSVYFTLLFGLLCITGIHYFGETRKEDEKLRPMFFVAAFLAIPLAIYMFITNCFIGVRIFTLDWMTLTLVLLVAGVVSLIIFLIVGKGWDTAKRNAFSSVVLPLTVFCALGDLLKTDYGAGGVLLIAVIYLFRKNKIKAFALGCTVLTLMVLSEGMAFFMLIPIGAYNGKRGMKLNKYVYYAFYPVHIGLIYLLALLMGFTTFAIR
ncbi:MAG: hypothetical protein J6Z33_11310 [Lachnospiraceae bacterium]|nr:hypothetical protein [Lachnospiraceae bacterium]